MNYPEKYQKIFDRIDEAGGEHLNNFKNMSISQKIPVVFNIWAFLLTIFYYLGVGLPKKAITYFLISLLMITVIENLSPELTPFTILIPSIIFGTRANLDLYKKFKLGQNDWF